MSSSPAPSDRHEDAAAYAKGDRVRVLYMDSECVATVEQVCVLGGNGAVLKEPYYRLKLPSSLGPPGLANYREHEMEPA